MSELGPLDHMLCARHCAKNLAKIRIPPAWDTLLWAGSGLITFRSQIR